MRRLTIILFALGLAAVTLLVIFRREYLEFNGYSAFPIVYLAFYIGRFFFLRTEAYIRWIVNGREFRTWQLWKTEGSLTEKQLEDNRDFGRRFSEASLIAMPWLIPFIFFCSYQWKAVSFLFTMIMTTVYFIACVLYEGKKESDAKVAKIRKEREEQERNEELGKWK